MKTYKTLYIILGIFALFVLLSLPHLVNNDSHATDADRIGMDGVFIMDFIGDLPGSALNIYDYTIEYYAKYPALSIGYRPAFFPLIEALFYAIFGLSHLSARMAVLLFLFSGMIFWVRLVREIYDDPTAWLSLLLWVTNPYIYQYAQQPMLEIPTLSMCIICVYYLCKYETDSSLRNGIILGIVTGLTLWTNQKSGFILMLLLAYPVIKGKGKLLLARNTWISAGIILVFLIPLAGITLWLGDQNLAQSIGVGSRGASGNWLARLKLFQNIYFLYHDHFSAPVLALAIIGMGSCFIRKDKGSLIFSLGIACILLFFTIIKIKVSRYPMYWIPFFTLFAALGLQTSVSWLERVLKFRKPFITHALISLPIILQLGYFPNVFVGYAGGYEQAAAYVLQRTRSPVIFFDGYANGQFIFFARKHDPDRQFVILRGTKIISSSSVSYRNKLEIHLHETEEIYKTFSDMGVQFAVVESGNVSGIKIHDELRKLLRDSSRFKLHKMIQVKSNMPALKDQNLLVYENLGYEEMAENQVLRLRLPIVGKTIQVKLEKILNDNDPYPVDSKK